MDLERDHAHQLGDHPGREHGQGQDAPVGGGRADRHQVEQDDHDDDCAGQVELLDDREALELVEALDLLQEPAEVRSDQAEHDRCEAGDEDGLGGPGVLHWGTPVVWVGELSKNSRYNSISTIISQ